MIAPYLRILDGKHDTATTWSSGSKCRHQTGWYGTVPFWIFRRPVFACSDCGSILYGKRFRAWMRSREGGLWTPKPTRPGKA